jgi:hypothetical protein
MDELSNDDLTLDHVPEPEAGTGPIAALAYTIDGYRVYGGFEPLAAVAEPALVAWRADGRLPDDLTALRACLFFEHRRWRHYGYEPDEEAQRYHASLVGKIREVVGRRGE